MALEYSRKFYRSREWKRTRAAFLQSKHYLCQRCGGAADMVHHVKHITPQNIQDPNITLNWENLLAVCRECHNVIHGYDMSCREDVMFTEDGQLVKRPHLDSNDLLHEPVRPWKPGVSRVFK